MRKLGWKLTVISLFVVLVLLAIFVMYNDNIMAENMSRFIESQIEEVSNETAETSFVNKISFSPASGATVVLDSFNNDILFAHNPEKKLPMASTTKVVTAITAIENCNINKVIDIPREAVGIEGSSIYLKKGDKYTLEDLLYGLMLRSGNDSATAIAIAVSGSVEKFSMLMNQTAKKAGAKNSNFVNPSGLHHEDHYTTAHDLALVTSYALKNETFKKIVSSKNHTITNRADDQKTPIQNKNKLLFNYKDATGVKTGFTKNAGRCFVGSAKRGDLELVFVTLNCGPMFEKCAEAFDCVFNKFTRIEFANENKPYAYITDKNGDKFKVVSKETKSKFVELEVAKDLSRKVFIDDASNKILKNDELIGKIEIFDSNQLIFSSKLYTIKV